VKELKEAPSSKTESEEFMNIVLDALKPPVDAGKQNRGEDD